MSIFGRPDSESTAKVSFHSITITLPRNSNQRLVIDPIHRGLLPNQKIYITSMWVEKEERGVNDWIHLSSPKFHSDWRGFSLYRNDDKNNILFTLAQTVPEAYTRKMKIEYAVY